MKTKSMLGVLFGLMCCAFVASPSEALGAAGDYQNATIRIRNVDRTGQIIGNVPAFVEDSFQSWRINTSNVTATLSVPLPKQVSARIRMNSTANGQIQPVYTDKYGFQWAEVFPVRHGASTYIYDLKRGFSLIKFVDQNNAEFAFDSLHLSTSPTGATINNMLFGGKNGYYFPVVPSGYYFIGQWKGQTVSINLDDIGASNWFNIGTLELNVPAAIRSAGAANADKIEIGKVKLAGEKITAVKVPDGFEMGVESKMVE